MKNKLIALSVALFLGGAAYAQDGYQFTEVKKNPITSIKNQANSGTCWSYSAMAFLESELLRMGKGEHDLSEMYNVRRNYRDKAGKYVRMHGMLNFAQGGSFADVVETIDEYGMIPEEAYKGLNYGTKQNVHGELESVLKGMVDAVIQNKNKTLTPVWGKSVDSVLDAYFGVVPTEFTYKGKTYTPQSWAKELGLASDNYVSFTSYTHAPFYKSLALEIPDNWRWSGSYNLPIDEMMKTIDNALEKGYTVAWASDVSEIGFTRDGIAVMPDENSPDNVGSDQAHWLGLSQRDKDAAIKKKLAEGPVKEKEITQEMRQIAYDNYQTTDDHGMLIYGIAKDQNGTKYYLVKNSWGETGKYKGVWYASEAFVKYKTMSVVIHKDAVPSDISKKIKL